MANNRGSTLFSLPFDVIAHHVFVNLKRADQVASSMACVAFRKIFLRVFSLLFTSKKSRFQANLFDDLFRAGTWMQLRWFQDILKYPNSGDFSWDKQEKIRYAAEGKDRHWIFKNHLLFVYLILYFYNIILIYINSIRRKFRTSLCAAAIWFRQRCACTVCVSSCTWRPARGRQLLNN